VNDLPWIDSLPISWKAKPLRATADYVVSNVDKVPADDEAPVRLCNYTDVYNNEFITLGLDFMQATATESEIAKFGLAVGDVIITKDSESWDDIGVPALVRESAGDLVCGYHLALLRPREQEVNGDFLFRCLQAKPVRVQLELAANGVTRFGIPKSDIGAATLPIPPLPVQRAIADYLDRETARLDALVAAKERVLLLLAEKRRALITRAVTRGLDPHAPLRDSGIPWLGEIPAHWEVTRLKFHLNGITQGWSPQCEALPAGSDDWGVLKAGCVNGDTFNAEENKRLPDSETPLPEIEVRPRDVVMSRANTTELVGSAAITPTNVRPRLLLSDKLYRLNVKVDELLPELLVYFLRTSPGRLEFERTASGASNSMQNISQDVVRNLWLPVPLQEEQRAIVEHISRETAKVDAVRAATERTIALLKERRAALIAAAVTGQIDVPSRAECRRSAG
jgi:type I restriction enzyme S subunit